MSLLLKAIDRAREQIRAAGLDPDLVLLKDIGVVFLNAEQIDYVIVQMKARLGQNDKR